MEEHWTRCIDVGNSIDVVYLDFLRHSIRFLIDVYWLSLKLMVFAANYFVKLMLFFQTGDKE